jgi:hypothetical protein
MVLVTYGAFSNMAAVSFATEAMALTWRHAMKGVKLDMCRSMMVKGDERLGAHMCIAQARVLCKGLSMTYAAQNC